jgi:hypothetical protein
MSMVNPPRASSARVAVAVVTSSVGMVAIHYFLLFSGLILFFDEDMLSVPVFLHGLHLFIFFGWPLALAVTAALAIPSYHYMTSRGLFSFGYTFGIGMIAGMVLVPAGMLLVMDHLRLDAPLLVIGGITGGTGASIFWGVVAKATRVVDAGEEGKPASCDHGVI